VLRFEGVASEEHRNTQCVNGSERDNGLLQPAAFRGDDDDARCIGRPRGDRQGERGGPGTQHPAGPSLEPQQQCQGLKTYRLPIAGTAGQQDRSDLLRWGSKRSSVVEPGSDCLCRHEVLSRVALTRLQQAVQVPHCRHHDLANAPRESEHGCCQIQLGLQSEGIKIL